MVTKIDVLYTNVFKYLGSIMTSNAKSTVDTTCRIAVAKNSFTEMKAILTNLKKQFQLKYQILTCCITPILLYGSENWTLNKTGMRKIKAAKMWFLRRMEKVKWTEKINEEVLNKTTEKCSIMSDISKRQILGERSTRIPCSYWQNSRKENTWEKKNTVHRPTCKVEKLQQYNRNCSEKQQKENSLLPKSFDMALEEEDTNVFPCSTYNLYHV